MSIKRDLVLFYGAFLKLLTSTPPSLYGSATPPGVCCADPIVSTLIVLDFAIFVRQYFERLFFCNFDMGK